MKINQTTHLYNNSDFVFVIIVAKMERLYFDD